MPRHPPRARDIFSLPSDIRAPGASPGAARTYRPGLIAPATRCSLLLPIYKDRFDQSVYMSQNRYPFFTLSISLSNRVFALAGRRVGVRARYAALKVRGATPGTGRCGGLGKAERAHLAVAIVRYSLRLFPWKLSLPRKEVIQPHVPVRLPCYDFTPLTLHTFDASPPRGLGRRLRVQTTRVV